MQIELPESPATVASWQSYIKAVVGARGWDEASELEVFLLLSEEVGEVAKALRVYRDLFSEVRPAAKDPTEAKVDGEGRAEGKARLAEELADVFSYLLDLANRFDIDLEDALRIKEIQNRERLWAPRLGPGQKGE